MEALLLVHVHRVLLTVGLKADALAQLRHGVDVVHPELVHHPQHDHPLQLPHNGRRHILLLLGIGLHGRLGEGLDAVLSGGGGDLVLRHGHGALMEIGALQAVQHGGILFAVQMLLLAEGQVHVPLDGGGDHVLDGTLHIQAVQHLLTLAIDDLTLLVHHVVVLQGVLSSLEVPALHAGLGALNGLGQLAALDGHILPQIQPVHHPRHPVSAEKPHEVVLQAQIEPGLTGVSLTAGTAAELVVDPAGVVALGTHDKEAARRPDLFCLTGDLIFVDLETVGKELPGV